MFKFSDIFIINDPWYGIAYFLVIVPLALMFVIFLQAAVVSRANKIIKYLTILEEK